MSGTRLSEAWSCFVERISGGLFAQLREDTSSARRQSKASWRTHHSELRQKYPGDDCLPQGMCSLNTVLGTIKRIPGVSGPPNVWRLTAIQTDTLQFNQGARVPGSSALSLS